MNSGCGMVRQRGGGASFVGQQGDREREFSVESEWGGGYHNILLQYVMFIL